MRDGSIFSKDQFSLAWLEPAGFGSPLKGKTARFAIGFLRTDSPSWNQIGALFDVSFTMVVHVFVADGISQRYP
jgi:hypothetical protein